MKGIMQSKRKPVDTISISDLDDSAASAGAKTKILGYEEKPEREAGKKFEGEPEEIAREVARLLDTEANVI